MPRRDSYWHRKAIAWLTPEQRAASEARRKEVSLMRAEKRRIRLNARLRAKRLQSNSPRTKQTHCLRGHERAPENVTPNGTCKLCPRKIRKKEKRVRTSLCPWCEKEFSTTNARKVYCSKRSCAVCARRSRKRQGLEPGAIVTRGKRGRKPKSYEEKAIRDAWRVANPGKKYLYKNLSVEERKAWNRREQLDLAGWTVASFTIAKQSQSGRCAICGEVPEPKPGWSEGLVPDHKHVVSPVPRGLLCPMCNSLIGFAKDSPERCEAAAAYLRKFS